MTKLNKPTKREATREKVILAAIDCIYRDGFHAAHTNRIAEEAGVSWGVLQYHFGDKDGLLQAVIDHIFDDFTRTLEATTLAGDDLQQRVRQLIDVVWQLVSKKEYRVSIAILRNAGKDESSSINGQKQLARWAKRTSQLWDGLFQDKIQEPLQSEIARHLLFATLRGMVDEINPKKSKTRQAIRLECDALSEAITFLLTRS
ncbi:MAG: TetR/AcrR family transcriptional regulator [Haliea sp.]|jgi:AcrR family transcriptional regulator|nr:TetR/AcrR family transcriptional regulator [Haliea sp.]